jgi:predicted restriction endonuclease
LHHRWNHDLSEEEREILRRYPEYNKWRKSVFNRDKYSCQICGHNKYVIAHHLFSYSAYPDKRLDLDNGITLCKQHHNEFHKWMGHTQISCTSEDFDNWVKECYTVRDDLSEIK